uniref:NADH-ubiquinone oxidoreductase chain 2 n=1 Tax=Spirobrachia sp. YL-2014 TaxID=1535021 RepID=A0A0E3DR25_9ANNE|nr:NADH dehydrogenase subunit 2 [Spirobrachia sp. YL-2014]
MLKSLPSHPLFYFTLFSGSLIAFSSSHWLFLWSGLELNLFSIIPLMINSSNSISLEASIKYFLIQLFSSIMLITSMMSLFMSSFAMSNMMMLFLFFMSMMTKLGMAPCHFWFPPVMAALSWPMCFILMTWQKLIPLFILMFTFSFFSLKIMFFVVILSSLIGGLGGLNQTQLRPLLAYSSITHMSWILSTISISPLISLSYFSCYSLILFPLTSIVYLFNINSNNQLFNIFSSQKNFFLIFTISILSLGGLPPLFGFFPKWMTMFFLLSNNMNLLLLFLILGSLLNLYFYLILIFPLYNFINFKFITLMKKSYTFFFFWVLILLMGIAPQIMMCF